MEERGHLEGREGRGWGKRREAEEVEENEGKIEGKNNGGVRVCRRNRKEEEDKDKEGKEKEERVKKLWKEEDEIIGEAKHYVSLSTLE